MQNAPKCSAHKKQIWLGANNVVWHVTGNDTIGDICNQMTPEPSNPPVLQMPFHVGPSGVGGISPNLARAMAMAERRFAGAWFVFSYDGSPYPIGLFGTEVEAGRMVNDLGYGKYKFWEFGTEWNDGR